MTISAPGLSPGDGAERDWFRARLAATQSFAFFVRNVLGNDCVDSRYGFHRDLCDFISRPRSRRKTVAMVMAARGYLKSSICTIYHSVWSWLVDPDERVMLMHGIEDRALSYLDEIVTISTRNAALRKMAPEIFGKVKVRGGTMTVGRPTEDKVPSIAAYGMNSATAGHHFTLYKLDDLVNDANYQTVAGIEQPIRKFQDIMSTRRGMRSRVDIVDTVYANDDLTQWIQNPDNLWASKLDVWARTCWYTGPRPDGGYYAPGEESWWPEQKPVEFLDEQRAIGPIKFAQQFLCEPATEGSRLFKPEWIQRYAPHVEDGKIVLPGEGEDDEPRSWKRFIALDGISGSGHTSRDRAVILVGAKNDRGDLYLLDIYYDRPKTAEWYDLVHRFWCEWRTDRMLMERVGVSAALWAALEEDGRKRMTKYPLWETNRKMGGRGYDAKTQRFESLQAFVSRRQLFVPEGKKWEAPIAEMLSYQYGIKNQQDDFLDCVFDLWDQPKPAAPAARTRAEAAWSAAATPRARRFGIGIRELARPYSRVR